MASRTVPAASGSSHRLRYDDVGGKRSSTGVGDTRLWLRAAPGGRLGRLGYKLAIDGWDGAAGVTEGVGIPGFQRDLMPDAAAAVAASRWEPL